MIRHLIVWIRDCAAAGQPLKWRPLEFVKDTHTPTMIELTVAYIEWCDWCRWELQWIILPQMSTGCHCRVNTQHSGKQAEISCEQGSTHSHTYRPSGLFASASSSLLTSADILSPLCQLFICLLAFWFLLNNVLRSFRCATTTRWGWRVVALRGHCQHARRQKCNQ